jgi:hypothetical protein
MEFTPYIEITTRHGKIITVLMVGIKSIETDNFGSPLEISGSFFPRIHVCYLNNDVVKLDFENQDMEQAKEAYRRISKISEDNIRYLVENNMLEQVFKISK